MVRPAYRLSDLRGRVSNAVELIAEESLVPDECLDYLRFDPKIANSVFAWLSIERRGLEVLVQSSQTSTIDLQ